MKHTLTAILFTALLTGCLGYSSKDNELIGQVKYVKNVTPLLVPGYFLVDISLGVMRNGVGSMSREDKFLFVTDQNQQEAFQKAAETGAIVKVHYNEHRIVAYGPRYEALETEVLQ